MSKVVAESKLRAIGNSTGVILPKELLDDLALTKGDKSL
jgi:antitoxin component of MazEF toxin-antitoxin module